MAGQEFNKRRSREIKREMGAMNVRSLAMVALVIAGIIITGEVVSAQFCQDDYKSIMMQCPPYINKEGPQTDPSGDCCDAMKKADIKCVCQVISQFKDVKQRISKEKMVYVANYCGTSVPSGIDCGS